MHSDLRRDMFAEMRAKAAARAAAAAANGGTGSVVAITPITAASVESALQRIDGDEVSASATPILPFHLVDLIWQYVDSNQPHSFHANEMSAATSAAGVAAVRHIVNVPSTPSARATAMSETLRMVCVSDTHRHHHQLRFDAGADLLIHSGDFTDDGTEWEARAFDSWIHDISHRFKYGVVCIAGNHDSCLAPPAVTTAVAANSHRLLPHVTHYLHNSGVTIAGVKFYGTPYVPHVSNATNSDAGDRGFYKSHTRLKSTVWSSVPDDTDVLITHSPPRGVLDGGGYGCPELANRISELKAVRVHVFGHVHGGYGVATVDRATLFPVCHINAACTDKHSPIAVNLATN